MVADLGGSDRDIISVSYAADPALAQPGSRTALRVSFSAGADVQAAAARASQFRPTLWEWLPLHRLFCARHAHRDEPCQDRRVVWPASLRVWLALSYVGVGDLLGALASFS